MNKILNHLEEWLVSFLMGGATLVIFIAVIHRYLSGIPIAAVQDLLLSLNFGWAQELCIIMFVWMAKFGAAYGVRTGIHVGVDVVINKMKDQHRAKFIIFGMLAGAFFTGTIAVLGGNFVWENGAHHAFLQALGSPLDGVPEGPTTPDLEWPTWVVYSVIPLGSSLMSFRFLQVAWNFIKTGELPTHEHGHVEGMDDVVIPVEANGYNLDDNLHPQDLKHKLLGSSSQGSGKS
ncbi:TRAP transporter small permease [Pseudogulbenkiania subflava]|uniref:TRAP transporter small permease protein n=1 Tax=Pseudogulbenkiania subflava DSM 22618 TaxID=1123014 RepID=A0A1Y6BZN4_9NEIS|nr:TRAP transporter small permease [Pseudogulbenkiania subflava]SMF26500.1 C4-dicarboxylate transporter, DctQ subunit [Pseudogulbenkiania subflava DSM 22618]